MLLDTSDKLLRERRTLMTSKMRREFTGEFKREAVLLLESSGRPPMQVAKEFGTQPSMLRNWRARGPGPAGAGNILLPASTEQAEIRRLRKELKRTQMECDV
jgi:transposase